MKTIALVSGKGGVGKTTLAAARAVRATQGGKRVALVDLDPLEFLAAWFGRRGDQAGLTLYHDAEFASEVIEALELTQRPDFIFFDTPPSHIEVVRDAIESVDLAIVPLRPGALDLLGSADTVVLADKAGTALLCVFNDVDSRWSGNLDAARRHLADDDTPAAATVIAHRSAYFAAMASGRTGPEISRDGKAGEEIDQLWSEVQAVLRKRRGKRA